MLVFLMALVCVYVCIKSLLIFLPWLQHKKALVFSPKAINGSG